MRNVVRQGGSVAVFVVVGVILVLVALGVLYGMRNIAMRDGTPPMSLPGIMGGDQKNTDDSSKKDDSAKDSEGSADQQLGSDKPSEDTGREQGGSSQAPTNESNSDPGASSNNQSAPSSDSSAPSETGSSSSNLPQSGPDESVVTMIIISVIATSVVAYIRSLKLS